MMLRTEMGRSMNGNGSLFETGLSMARAREANGSCFSRAVGLAVYESAGTGEGRSELLAVEVLPSPSLFSRISVSNVSSGSLKKTSGDSPSLKLIARPVLLELASRYSTLLKRTRLVIPPVEGGVMRYDSGGVCGRSTDGSMLNADRDGYEED